MKNKKAKKNCPSIKKYVTPKIAVTVLLAFVLLCGAVVGTIAAISDGFTKPVEDWFCDKATVTPGDQTGDDQTGDDQTGDDQTGDNQTGDDQEDTDIKFGTKLVNKDELVTVNYYTMDLQLLESKTVNGKDLFPSIEGYEKYYFIFPSEITVPTLENIGVYSIIIDGKICEITDFESTGFSSFYPMVTKIEDQTCVTNIPVEFFGKINDEFVIVDSSSDLVVTDGFSSIKVSGGDTMEILSSFSDGIFVSDGLFYKEFTDYLGEISSDIDIINVLVR